MPFEISRDILENVFRVVLGNVSRAVLESPPDLPPGMALELPMEIYTGLPLGLSPRLP